MMSLHIVSYETYKDAYQTTVSYYMEPHGTIRCPVCHFWYERISHVDTATFSDGKYLMRVYHQPYIHLDISSMVLTDDFKMLVCWGRCEDLYRINPYAYTRG